jgi:dipeptidyl aminopeptidase/acylaminoacyl peptidase
LEGSDRFLWISERDGWAHIYLYDLGGTLVRQLTKGEYPVSRIVAVDEAEGWIYFTAHGEERVYDTHLYRVPLDGGEMVRLTEGEGQHEVFMSPSSMLFVDTHSSVTRPPSSELRRVDGTLVQVLENADIEDTAPLHRVSPEEFVVKAADGESDLWGLIYKPWDFDPQKKYPVIDHLYGGPQTTWAPRTYDGGSYGVLAHAIAQLGYMVFIVDARGTPERGKAFQDVVYGQLGRNEIPDHVAALEQLAERFPYFDAERVGVYGNSWGGYFTLRAMLLYPDVYDAGVAGAPVSDVTQYIGHEMYLGPLADNLEAYDYGSNSKIAHRLKGNLLIPIGTSDKNVRFAFTMKMAEALIRAEKYFDMMVLPERDHHYGYTGKERPWHERIYFAELTRRHFQKYLPPDVD